MEVGAETMLIKKLVSGFCPLHCSHSMYEFTTLWMRVCH